MTLEQDRLKEWRQPVGDKLKHLGCLPITALDIDGYRRVASTLARTLTGCSLDKAAQLTIDFSAEWVSHIRSCAREVGKENFIVAGEITSGNTFASLYLGRGRTPAQLPPGFLEAANMTAAKNSSDPYFLRGGAQGHGMDAAAFDYSTCADRRPIDADERQIAR